MGDIAPIDNTAIQPLAVHLDQLMQNDAIETQTFLEGLSIGTRGRVVSELVDGKSALTRAYTLKNHFMMTYLIEKCNADIEQTTWSSTEGVWSPTTLLIQAAFSGDLRAAQILLANGALINKADSQSVTPLHAACNAGHLDMVRYLVSLWADVNYRDNGGLTPVKVAERNHHKAIARYLKRSSRCPSMDCQRSSWCQDMNDKNPYGTI